MHLLPINSNYNLGRLLIFSIVLHLICFSKVNLSFNSRTNISEPVAVIFLGSILGKGDLFTNIISPSQEISNYQILPLVKKHFLNHLEKAEFLQKNKKKPHLGRNDLGNFEKYFDMSLVKSNLKTTKSTINEPQDFPEALVPDKVKLELTEQ